MYPSEILHMSDSDMFHWESMHPLSKSIRAAAEGKSMAVYIDHQSRHPSSMPVRAAVEMQGKDELTCLAILPDKSILIVSLPIVRMIFGDGK